MSRNPTLDAFIQGVIVPALLERFLRDQARATPTASATHVEYRPRA